MPSFELALAAGVDAIETDVHLTKDGVPVAIHDRTVDRTTNGHGAVADLTLSEIRALDASGRFHATYPDARVPTLAEILAWARGRTRVVVELKGTTNRDLVPRVLSMIEEYRMEDDALLISFDHHALQQVVELNPRMMTGALYVARPVDLVGLARATNADVLCPQWSSADPADVTRAHAADFGVSVWTCDDPLEIQLAVDAGVDAITTNFPERAIAALRSG